MSKNYEIKRKKEKIREEIWRKLEKYNIARFPLPCKGRIPNFVGSGIAAKKVTSLKLWKKAKVVLANPDYAQKKIRELALIDNKTLIMASPRLKCGYFLLNPKKCKNKENFATTIKGAFILGESITKLPKVDLVISGSVAVDLKGNRLGKGGGYGDREIKKARQLNKGITVITTVHDMQVVKKVPTEKHDEKVDIIVTPTKIIYVQKFN